MLATVGFPASIPTFPHGNRPPADDPITLRNAPAHLDDDHPVTLLGDAMGRRTVTSSQGIVVRHTGGPPGSGPFGVGCCASGLEFRQALELIGRLQGRSDGS